MWAGVLGVVFREAELLDWVLGVRRWVRRAAIRAFPGVEGVG